MNFPFNEKGGSQMRWKTVAITTKWWNKLHWKHFKAKMQVFRFQRSLLVLNYNVFYITTV